MAIMRMTWRKSMAETRSVTHGARGRTTAANRGKEDGLGGYRTSICKEQQTLEQRLEQSCIEISSPPNLMSSCPRT